MLSLQLVWNIAGEIVSFHCQVRQHVFKRYFSWWHWAFYSTISKHQMCFNSCDIGGSVPRCASVYVALVAVPKQRRKIRVKVEGVINKKHCPIFFPAKSAPWTICSLAHPVRTRGQSASKPVLLVYLTMSSCSQELMESTSVRSSWFWDAFRIWNCGENQSQCLLLLADLCVMNLEDIIEHRIDVEFGPFCTWHTSIFTRNTSF